MSVPGWRPRASSRSSSSPASSSPAASSQQLGRGVRFRLELRLRHAEKEGRRDEPLLGAVVQVALEPPALLVAGPHDPRARRLQVLACLRARDRERDEVAERGEPHFGVGGQRVGAADRDRTPARAGDDDRRRHRRAVADPQHQLLVLALGRAPVVDPGGQAGFARLSDQRGLLDEQASAERERVDPVAVEARDHGGGVVAFVAPDGRRVHLEHARALRRHGHEHALRARLRGDERRHAPKRTLLLGQPAHFDELRPRVVGEPALAGLLPRGQVDAARDEVRRCVRGRGHEPVRPCDQAEAAVLRPPVADLRARVAAAPDVCEHFAERIALLGRDQRVGEVAADHLVAREARRALAGVVEEEGAPGLVQHADERLCRLREHAGELVAELEVS